MVPNEKAQELTALSEFATHRVLDVIEAIRNE
jgi:hypothetical protein